MLPAAVSAIALGLLGAAGVAKTIDPVPTGGALRAARLPSQPWSVRLLGGTEVAASIVGLAFGGPWVSGAALLYLGFLTFTWLALRNVVPGQSCGCFGREDTPPSWIHVGYNLAGLIALVSVVVGDGSPIPWDAPMVEAALYLAYAAVGSFVSYLLLARLPNNLAATTPR